MTAKCKEQTSLLDIRHFTLQDQVKVIRKGDGVPEGWAYIRIFIQSSQHKKSNSVEETSCAKTLLIVKEEKPSTAQIWIAAKKVSAVVSVTFQPHLAHGGL